MSDRALRRVVITAKDFFSLLVHSLGGEGYLNFEGNEFGHPEVELLVFNIAARNSLFSFK